MLVGFSSPALGAAGLLQEAAETPGTGAKQQLEARNAESWSAGAGRRGEVITEGRMLRVCECLHLTHIEGGRGGVEEGWG